MTSNVCIIRQRGYGELALQREADELAAAGAEVHVICMAEAGKPRRERRGTIHIHRLPVSRVRGSKVRYLLDYALFFLLAGIEVTRLQRRHRFPVIQVNTMPDFLVFCTAVARRMGARIVVFMKEPTPELGEMLLGSGRWPRMLIRIEQAALAWADAAITVTEDLKQTYVERGADPDKIHVVLNGPPANAFPPLTVVPTPDPDHFTLLYHGAVEERYGHDTIVRAVALTRDELPQLRFRFTGVGPEVDDLLELANELGVADRVECLGWLEIDELAQALAEADVGVVAQLRSPYSDLVHTNKMYEYMIFEKPVIAGRLRSVSRYFDDRCLHYFEPGDPESLAAAILEVASNSDRRTHLVAAASERLADYRWERQAEEYLRVFRDLGLDLEDTPGRFAA